MNPKLIYLEEKNFWKASLIDYRIWACHTIAFGWPGQRSQSFHQLTFLLCCPWSRSKNALILHQFAWNMKHSGSMLIFKPKNISIGDKLFRYGDFFSEKIIVGPQEAQYSQFLLQLLLTHYILRSTFFWPPPTPPICIKMPKCAIFGHFWSSTLKMPPK